MECARREIIMGTDSSPRGEPQRSTIAWFDTIGIDDVARVGGKNASLGEMYQRLAGQGVRVPNGFATTADAYRAFLHHNHLDDRISELLSGWDRTDVDDLATRSKAIRSLILAGELPEDFVTEVTEAYRALSSEADLEAVDVAVRSSATAEDLPEASFAGQQETYLMIHGTADVLDAIRRCFASLFTARAVNYREDMGVDQLDVALSVGIQRMVRADLASSGVIFTLDTDSGFDGVIYLTGSWGLGENIVQGRVIPDSFFVHKDRLRNGFRPLVGRRLGEKELTMRYDAASNRIRNDNTSAADRARFCISDDEVLDLARWALIVEDYYSDLRGQPTPMDLEWAKDGRTGELFIVQARPETVHSKTAGGSTSSIHRLTERSEVLLRGLAVGDRISSGHVRRIDDPKQMSQLRAGEILVTEITDPDWEPILKRAAAVVTERGGRTSHAAIVARELGIPAIVGAGAAARELPDGAMVTVCCAEGDVGIVYAGELAWDVEEFDLTTLPETRTDIMVNLGDPSFAYQHALLPTAGIGLARMEFIFASHVRVHPLALTRYDELDATTKREVDAIVAGYGEPTEYLVDKVAVGVGTLAAAFWPRPVILRFSDFKTNEYASLVGGRDFEPSEPNPMLGWRGASRYYHPDYRDGFELEIRAVRRVREEFGLTNLKVMIPFCRTPEEGRQVVDVLRQGGLVQGVDGLEIYVMAEIPSNVLQAEAFAEIFDGFSIGSNDLTQLVLGVDRDSESVAVLFDEQDAAVERACSMVIAAAHESGRKIGICGQGPSDHPEFAAFLVEQGIDSISVTPDALARTIARVAEAEATLAT
jgi:pyruvate, water dikinase